MDIKLKVYNGVKYNKDSKEVGQLEYKNIQSYEHVFGERAKEIELETDENSRDEFNEYLIITLEDGETLTFCNSHVELYLMFYVKHWK